MGVLRPIPEANLSMFWFNSDFLPEHALKTPSVYKKTVSATIKMGDKQVVSWITRSVFNVAIR